jgi:hypothetical protein
MSTTWDGVREHWRQLDNWEDWVETSEVASARGHQRIIQLLLDKQISMHSRQHQLRATRGLLNCCWTAYQVH